MTQPVEVVVIGAGQAGLAVSYHLTRSGIQHVVLERGSLGASWREQRWDSFCLNTPNWCNGLPGMDFPGPPDAFAHRDELLSYFERYAQAFELPVQEQSRVTGLTRLASGSYTVNTDDRSIEARAVVLATGSMSRPRVPEAAARLPSDVLSISAGAYRSPGVLPEGRVVVVGTGQSGCQIAEDLLEAGREVFVCASRVGRVPRVYRGRDIVAWWSDMGFLDVGVEELEDPAIRFAAQPHVSGTKGGHTVSLQSLARDGAVLLGRLVDVREGSLQLGGDLTEAITFADEKSRQFKKAIDEWIERSGIDAPAAGDDPGEPPLPDLQGSDQRREVDLRAEGVGCVIWCTGFDADWGWIDVDVFEEGTPRHEAGITDSPGLYFVGHPWLSRRSSGILYGIGRDAERIVDHIRREVLA